MEEGIYDDRQHTRDGIEKRSPDVENFQIHMFAAALRPIGLYF